MEIPSILENSAQRMPGRKAVFFGLKTVSYAALDRQANRWANALRGRGIGPGDKVGLLLRNSPEFIHAVFAVLKLGAVIVPINNFLKGDEIRYILSDAKAKLLITSTDFLGTVGQDFSTVDVQDAAFAQAVSAASTQRPKRALEDTEDAVIIYTSGTTGKPKGAVLTHRNITSNAEASVKTVDVTHKDRFLLILPMFHSFTFTVCIMMPLLMGAGIVIVPSVQPFSRVLRNMILRRATLFAAVPQVYQLLGARKIPAWVRSLIRLRLCISGAAALPMAAMQAFEKNLNIPLLEGYGLSESSPVVSINPLHGKRKPGTVGLPIPGVTVDIFDDSMKKLETGQIGEICVKGPNVMKGYWNLPQATDETIRDGWLRTGDMGHKDKEGYITIVDRKKEMIIVRGMNVYPKEVEEVLLTHPAIAQVAVVGKQDHHRGEVPMAAAIRREGQDATPREILKYCQAKLADYKLPKKLLFVQDFPRNPTGKILKREIAKIF